MFLRFISGILSMSTESMVRQRRAGFVHFCCPVIFVSRGSLGKIKGRGSQWGRVCKKSHTCTYVHVHTAFRS